MNDELKPSSVLSHFAPAQAWWQGLAERERRLALLAAAVVVLGLVWLLAVQPAWRTIARAPAELDTLDAQLQTMQRLAAEVQQLPSGPNGAATALYTLPCTLSTSPVTPSTPSVAN